MGVSHLGFGGPKETMVRVAKQGLRGLFGFLPLTGQVSGIAHQNADGAMYEFCTGSSDIPDVTYNQSAAVNLMPGEIVPYFNNAQLRPYLAELSISVVGPTPWNGGYVAITDSYGCPLVHIPATALRDMASISFPNSEIVKPLYLGPNSGTGNGANYVTTYAAGVLTLAGNGLPTTTLAGVPIQIIAGTGKGQTSYITSNTATTVTLTQPFAVAPDATSVYAIYYVTVTAAAASTVTFVSNAIAANALDNGFNAIVVGGTGLGGVRQFASNTVATAGPPQTTVGSIPTSTPWNTQPVAGSLLCVSTNTESLGALDLSTDLLQAAATQGSTLQAVVGTGATAGSSVRIRGKFFWGP